MVTTSDGACSFSMVLVENRAWTRRVDALDLHCDERERLTELPKAYDRWLAGACTRTHPKSDDHRELVKRSGRATLAIGDRRLVGIISPDSGREPAVWLSVALNDLLTGNVVRRDLIWRPAMLRIRVPGWSFTLAYVSQRDRSPLGWRRVRDRQERSLVTALGGQSRRRERWSRADA